MCPKDHMKSTVVDMVRSHSETANAKNGVANLAVLSLRRKSQILPPPSHMPNDGQPMRNDREPKNDDETFPLWREPDSVNMISKKEHLNTFFSKIWAHFEYNRFFQTRHIFLKTHFPGGTRVEDLLGFFVQSAALIFQLSPCSELRWSFGRHFLILVIPPSSDVPNWLFGNVG